MCELARQNVNKRVGYAAHSRSVLTKWKYVGVQVFNAREEAVTELAAYCYQHEADGFMQRDTAKPLIQTRPPLAATGSTRLQEAVGLSAMNPPHTRARLVACTRATKQPGVPRYLIHHTRNGETTGGGPVAAQSGFHISSLLYF